VELLREERVRAAVDALRRRWRVLCAIAFALLLLPLVPGRLPLPGGDGVGFKSYARNVAIAVVLGAFLRAEGLALVRSRLLLPLAGLASAAWLSVAVNLGAAGEARLFVVTIGVFYAARLLAAGPRGRDLLFHWLGAFAVATVAAEIAANPALLSFDPALRDTLRFTHPNSLGGSLAILLPVFVGGMLGGRRVAGGAYAAAAVLGVAISFSRAALLASVAGLALLAAVRRARLAVVDRPWRAVAVGVVAAAAIAGLSLGRGEADSQRLRILTASWSLFEEQPVFGIGFGIENLRRVFPARYIELYGQSLFLFHSHNVFIEALVGMGVVGAVALTWFLARLAALAVAVRRSARTPDEAAEAAGFAASVGAFLLLGATDSFFYQGQMLMALAVLWGLMEATADARARGPAGALVEGGEPAEAGGTSRGEVDRPPVVVSDSSSWPSQAG